MSGMRVWAAVVLVFLVGILTLDHMGLAISSALLDLLRSVVHILGHPLSVLTVPA